MVIILVYFLAVRIHSHLDFQTNCYFLPIDGTNATQINKIVCHPTMPVVVSGHEDRYIRFFDVNSGMSSIMQYKPCEC